MQNYIEKIEYLNFNFEKNIKLIYLSQNKILEWTKTWGKKIDHINKEIFEKFILNNFKSDYFYCSNSDPTLIWITKFLDDACFASSNEVFSISKNDFEKFKENNYYFLKNHMLWKTYGF